MLAQHRLMVTPNVDIRRHLVRLVHPLTKYLLLNCKIMPNTRTLSHDGYSQCGHTKAMISDTCTSFNKILVIKL